MPDHSDLTPPFHRHSSRLASVSSSINTFSTVNTTNPSLKPDGVNYISFNQDALCIALGLPTGYKMFRCLPAFGPGHIFYRAQSIGIVEMLYSTSLVAIVALGEEHGSSPRKLVLLNAKRQSTICDLVFPSTIIQVKLTSSRLVVLLENQIYIYDVSNMALIHTVETSLNPAGICAVLSLPMAPLPLGSGKSYLAYPSPPKTIIHDSLLATGIITNGGLNSATNNISSVSNAPNRIGDVIVFDLELLQPVCVIEAHKSAIAALVLSKDGSLLATASDKGTIIRVFSVDSGVKLYQFRRGTYPTRIYSLAFSSNNQHVLATSSSGTVHIFRLGAEEALSNKHMQKAKAPRVNPIAEEAEGSVANLVDDGDDSDALNECDNLDDDTDDESDKNKSNLNHDKDNIENNSDKDIIENNSDKDIIENNSDNESPETALNDGGTGSPETGLAVSSRPALGKPRGSFTSDHSGIYISSSDDIPSNVNPSPSSAPSTADVTPVFATGESVPQVSVTPAAEPIVDRNRLLVARLIRRSSQKLGRKAAQKMGDFLPLRFSLILEPTRHFASLKINSLTKDVRSIAQMASSLEQDLVPLQYFTENRDHKQERLSADAYPPQDLKTCNMLHIHVVTSDGFFYVYGLDPQRGGDCILLKQHSLLDENDK